MRVRLIAILLGRSTRRYATAAERFGLESAPWTCSRSLPGSGAGRGTTRSGRRTSAASTARRRTASCSSTRSSPPRGRGALLERARPRRRARRQAGARPRHGLLAHAQRGSDGRALRRARLGADERQERRSRGARASSPTRSAGRPAPRRHRGVPHGARGGGRLLDPGALARSCPATCSSADGTGGVRHVPGVLAPREDDHAALAASLRPLARPPDRAHPRLPRRARARRTAAPRSRAALARA